MIPVLAQIVQTYLPGYKIEEIARNAKVKAREFSYSAQVYLLMLGQFAHVFSLNELVDLASIFSGELRKAKGYCGCSTTSGVDVTVPSRATAVVQWKRSGLSSLSLRPSSSE